MDEIIAGKLELGIDIGTSFSRVAVIDDSVTKMQTILLELAAGDRQIPSVMLLGKSGELVDFGDQALNRFQQGQGEYLVREFKMNLGGLITFPEFSVDTQDLYRVFLTCLRQRVEEKYNLQIKGARICITHPADESNAMGLLLMTIAEGVFPGCEILHIDEPSAVVQFIDTQEGFGFLNTKPEHILVIDSGGGTTDFSLAKAEYPRLRDKPPLTIVGTSRVNYGGRNIDQAIYDAIYEKISDSLNRHSNRQKERVLQIIRNTKDEYDWESKDNFRVSIGSISVDLLYEEIMQCVRPVMEVIVKEASRIAQSAQKAKKTIEVIVLAGGNSSIPFLKEMIQEKLPFISSIESVPPYNLQTAIAEGAVDYTRKSNDSIRYQLAYDVFVQYKFGNRTMIKNLGKRSEKHPDPKKGSTEILAQAISINELPITLIFEDKHETRSTTPITISFDPPLKRSDTRIKISFDIDASGYLQYIVEPYGARDKQDRYVCRKFLFDVSVPEW